MKIAPLYAHQTLTISFELFPPKTEEAEGKLMDTAGELKKLGPSFFTVTYGAGGSTREKTLRLADRVRRQAGVEAMPHLTAVGQSRAEILEILREMRRLGIENVLALRGDPPRGETEFRPHPDGLKNATEMVQFIRQHFPEQKLCIAVAGNPEGHREAASKEENWRHLKLKLEAGAQFVLTQLFWDNACYYEFREACRRLGIEAPLVPGVLPVLSTRQVRRFSELSGAKIPPAFAAKLDAIGDDDERATEFGIEYASEQCRDLIAHGVPGLHLYCLNRTRSVAALLRNLGLAS
jgi:methylenetetrahydrofolate reductase (NADPH)